MGSEYRKGDNWMYAPDMGLILFRVRATEEDGTWRLRNLQERCAIERDTEEVFARMSLLLSRAECRAPMLVMDPVSAALLFTREVFTLEMLEAAHESAHGIDIKDVELRVQGQDVIVTIRIFSEWHDSMAAADDYGRIISL